MARIKYVINERRLAYEGAIKIHEEKRLEVIRLRELYRDLEKSGIEHQAIEEGKLRAAEEAVHTAEKARNEARMAEIKAKQDAEEAIEEEERERIREGARPVDKVFAGIFGTDDLHSTRPKSGKPGSKSS